MLLLYCNTMTRTVMMTLVIQTTVLVGVDRKRRNSVLVSSACYS